MTLSRELFAEGNGDRQRPEVRGRRPVDKTIRSLTGHKGTGFIGSEKLECELVEGMTVVHWVAEMFLLNEPSAAMIDSFIAAAQHQQFSYGQVGASRGQAPDGYNVDHNRVRLGSGEEVFVNAVAALRAWKMFPAEWCRVYPANAAIEVGTTVAVRVSHFGFWSLNANRIVYVLEEKDKIQMSGFAYGTLTEHGETGEERFRIEWHERDDSVWYEVYAFSRPGRLLAQLGYPLTRMLQKRFARESKEAMLWAVKSCAGVK
jgi:uncharacterized protein (UPF0548 family)